jgi:hypothetical protein
MASTKDVAEVIMIDIEYTESFAWKLGTYIKLIDLGEAMTQGKIIELGISDTQNETSHYLTRTLFQNPIQLPI